MSVSTSRWLPKRTAAPSGAVGPAGPTVAEALDPATVVLLRVTCRWDQAFGRRWFVVGYTHRHVEVRYSRNDQDALFEWLRERFDGIDWTIAHDADLSTGRIGAAPLVEDFGGIPEIDSSFGEPRPPVYVTAATPPLPFSATTLRRAA